MKNIHTGNKLSLARGRWLAQSAVLGFVILFAVQAGNAAAPEATIEEIKTISKQPEFYNGWPAVARRKNGQLIVTWSGGRYGHVCPFGRVEMMTSFDDGKTWTWPRILLDTDIDDRDSGVMETAKGTLIVTTFTALVHESANYFGSKTKVYKDIPSWIAVHARIADDKKCKEQLGEFALRSTDDGL